MLWNIKYCLWFAWCSWREHTRCAWGLHQACLGPSRLRGVVRGGWIFSDGDIGQKLDSLQIQTPNCDGSKPAWRNRTQEVLTVANPQLLLLHPPFLGTVRAQNTRGWRRKLSRGSRLGWGVFCDVEETLAFRKRGRKKTKGKPLGTSLCRSIGCLVGVSNAPTAGLLQCRSWDLFLKCLFCCFCLKRWGMARPQTLWLLNYLAEISLPQNSSTGVALWSCVKHSGAWVSWLRVCHRWWCWARQLLQSNLSPVFLQSNGSFFFFFPK